MSLTEDIRTALPSNVTDVKVDRNKEKGLEMIQVTTEFMERDVLWSLQMNFAQKNKMDAEHMAAVIESYMKEPHD